MQIIKCYFQFTIKNYIIYLTNISLPIHCRPDIFTLQTFNRIICKLRK